MSPGGIAGGQSRPLIFFLQISVKSWRKKYKIDHVSKIKNDTKQVLYVCHMSDRSIPIIPANLTTLKKIEFLAAQNATFGRP